ncbi:similar to Saccharomyces cerevisiae YDR201W SPC19 Essential subunit of the Dam1 complex (aka DASH complex) [Maudiozyma saulgeensis]|uniref:DASH complex subunit SPC19 n=1 Tax=Maudiozyma saulgeensis TaxID=1789683 RepID=A0A1X7R5L9_9SACH|nr:similar to Saccharomyces cerevisiae YDR201W SPC19 Essential subunit of the Dam1 complex (aka DASH complex) [Kazachstania saulgeensis]
MDDPLEESLWHLQEINELLESSVHQLQEDSKQNDDLTKTMLRFKQVYELVPEFDIERARIDLNEEVEPIIHALGDKLKETLNRRAIDLNTLKQKYELNKLKLNNNYNNQSVENDDSMDNSNESGGVVVMGSTTNEELEELKQLRVKKDELQKRLNELKN